MRRHDASQTHRPLHATSAIGDRAARIRSAAPYLMATLLFAAALGLRLYRIEAQSLWADEGGTIALASRSFAQIAHDTVVDVHPPLYYWALHTWIAALGSSVAVVRGFSAICGALAAVLTYLLGRRWFGAPAAVAGIASALSPLAIHYAQETRMYALVMLLGVLVWVALDRYLAQPRWYWLAALLLAELLAITTHYFAISLVAAASLAWLIDLFARWRSERAAGAWRLRLDLWRSAAAWVGAHAALAALYLLVVRRSYAMLAIWKTIPRASFVLADVVGDTLRAFSVGTNVEPRWSIWSAGFAVLLAVGLLARAPAGRPGGRARAAIWLFVPLAIMLILASDQPRYQPRFMLLALPGFHLLAGRGAAALGGWRPARRLAVPLAIAFIALGARQPLANEWFNPAFWRDDYRGIARTIAATAGPDDAILAMGQSQIDTLNYYFTGQQPRYLLPRTRPLDRDATVRDLEALARRHRRLYVLYYVPYEADPDGVIAGWLQEHAFTEHSQWYGGVELVSYELGGPDGAARLVNAQFGPQTWLERVAIGPTTVRASDGVRVVMEWRAETPSAPALNVFVHLLDGAGQLVAQHDGRLELRVAAGDVTQQSRYAVLVPSGAAPGVYRLIAGVYDPTTGERLRLPDGGDALPLGEIRVAAQPEGAP